MKPIEGSELFRSPLTWVSLQMWGDFDDAPSSKKARKALSAAEGWEALLQQRQATSQVTDFSFEAPPRFSLAFLVSGQPGRLEVRDGPQVTARLPALLPFTRREAEKRLVDLREAGVQHAALAAALRFALAPGAAVTAAELWSPSLLRPISRASRDAEHVEEALHCLEVLRAAELLDLKPLRDEAERRLQGGLLSESSALAVLASSFGREKPISQRCVGLLTMAGKDFLIGKERQLGVIYATAPLVGSLVAGLFKASRPEDRKVRPVLTSELRALLHGPSKEMKSVKDFAGVPVEPFKGAFHCRGEPEARRFRPRRCHTQALEEQQCVGELSDSRLVFFPEPGL